MTHNGSSAAYADVDVTVKISGIKTEQCTIQAQLFSEATQGEFPGGKGLKLLLAVPSRDGVTLIFRVAQPGLYAIAAMHDVNGNGKLDTNFVGMPQEPVGNSSGEPVRGKPTFKAAQFRVDQSNVDVAIKLN